MRGVKRGIAGGVVGAAISIGLVLASVTAGLQVSGTQYIRGYPPAAGLEAGRPPGGFTPLALRFVSRILGLEAEPNAAARAGRPAPVAAGRNSPPSASRINLSHAFTNDDFAKAIVVASVPFTARSNTRSATREAGEPKACDQLGGTAWYRYVAPTDGAVRATTFGSDYALKLGVFAGRTLRDLTLVGCGNGPTGNANVGFRVRAGGNYYFQVTNAAAGGALLFNLDPVGRTERVSVSSNGAQADGANYTPSLSSDGRYVAFNSVASNLTPESPQCTAPERFATSAPASPGVCPMQVYVKDRRTGSTSIVSRSPSGEAANGSTFSASLSADSRFVSFTSTATNLVPGSVPICGGESGRCSQIYVHDRATGLTERVSQTIDGQAAAGFSGLSSISGDGRHVAFVSSAPRLVASEDDPCGRDEAVLQGCPAQIYLRDRLTRRTVLVSADTSGGFGNFSSSRPSLSSDGSTVAFDSFATNLVRSDRNEQSDVFVRDVRTNTTELISLSTSGAQGTARSVGTYAGGRVVSRDGSVVAFLSDASNLVDGDTNEVSDFFVRDRAAGVTTRVSVSSAGQQARANPTPMTTSGSVAISEDGRFVTFDSALLDLVEDRAVGPLNVYLRDRLLGSTIRVSVSSLGEPGDHHSLGVAVGGSTSLVVAFFSGAKNLVPGDDNTGCAPSPNTATNCPDVFVHELPPRS